MVSPVPAPLPSEEGIARTVGLLLEDQGHTLALTVVHVPHSLGRGGGADLKHGDVLVAVDFVARGVSLVALALVPLQCPVKRNVSMNVKRLNLWNASTCVKRLQRPARRKTVSDPQPSTYTRGVATRKPCPSQWGLRSGGEDPEYLWLDQPQYTFNESHTNRDSSKPTIRLPFGTDLQEPCYVKRQTIPGLRTGARPSVDSDTIQR